MAMLSWLVNFKFYAFPLSLVLVGTSGLVKLAPSALARMKLGNNIDLHFIDIHMVIFFLKFWIGHFKGFFYFTEKTWQSRETLAFVCHRLERGHKKGIPPGNHV